MRYLLKAVICIGIVALSGLACQGTEDAYVPEPWDSHPVWSPDGTKIAFVSTRGTCGPDEADGPDNIWVTNANGTGLTQLTTDGGNTSPTWCPDGAKIAYAAGSQIWYTALATKQTTELTKGDAGGFDPDWNTANANKIICWFDRDMGDCDLFLIKVDTVQSSTSGRRPLSTRIGNDYYPRWSRDGSKVAFIGRVGNGDTSALRLMTMNSDGSNIQTHCLVDEWCTRLSWFPDGNRILLDGGDVYNLSTRTSAKLFPDEDVKDGDVSPDGTKVAYVRVVEDYGQFIFVRNIDGTSLTQVTKRVATPSFSPSEEVYNTDQAVAIASTSGATIRYTTDGSDPTDTSTLYTGPVDITHTTTLKAKAWKTDYCSSAISSATYVMQPLTPTIFLAEGTPCRVTIGCATTGTDIYYTTDGSEPTSSSTHYSGSFDLSISSDGITIKAIACKPGWTDSEAAVFTVVLLSRETISQNNATTLPAPYTRAHGFRQCTEDKLDRFLRGVGHLQEVECYTSGLLFVPKHARHLTSGKSIVTPHCTALGPGAQAFVALKL